MTLQCSFLPDLGIWYSFMFVQLPLICIAVCSCNAISSRESCLACNWFWLKWYFKGFICTGYNFSESYEWVNLVKFVECLFSQFHILFTKSFHPLFWIGSILSPLCSNKYTWHSVILFFFCFSFCLCVKYVSYTFNIILPLSFQKREQILNLHSNKFSI